jgi:hypothetical protein
VGLLVEYECNRDQGEQEEGWNRSAQLVSSEMCIDRTRHNDPESDQWEEEHPIPLHADDQAKC